MEDERNVFFPFVCCEEKQARNSVHHLRGENSYRNGNGEIISISSRQKWGFGEDLIRIHAKFMQRKVEPVNGICRVLFRVYQKALGDFGMCSLKA